MVAYRFKLLFVMLLAALFLLQYRLWFETGGLRDMLRLKKKVVVQTTENEKLKKRNQELLSQVQQLQNNGQAVESRARNELGMIKKDETFYQVVN